MSLTGSLFPEGPPLFTLVEAPEIFKIKPLKNDGN